ncbi:GNAT family N-acetyltransferase [Asanoa sp. NPDC050611]|uniref:GNAT family N-acetyltransferase n=1 Tax=Asanoa sp. NPDC050611 TaxID=3157098 RepID=UPI0033CF8AC6
MTDDPLLARARRLWCLLAGSPVVFGGTGIDVAVSPSSALCPPGWVGVVSLGSATIATVPSSWALHTLAAVPASSWLDPHAIRAALPVASTLGPATLAYLDAPAFRPVEGAVGIAADDPEVKALLARVPAEDAEESALSEITSPAFVALEGPRVVAAAGYRLWPGGTAHLSVLTDPTHRSRGLARATASAAIAAALAEGLLPQWRARHAPSRRVAAALGFRAVGWQLSLRLATPS